MSIDVHGVVAQEADQSDTALIGQFDGQAGGSGDGGDAGNARQQGLLDDLERGAPAYQQDSLFVGIGSMQQSMPDELVNSIMAANIFAQQQQFAATGKDSSSVQAPGMSEDGLLLAQLSRKFVEHHSGNAEGIRLQRGNREHEVGNAVLAAESAARGDGEVALEGDGARLHCGLRIITARLWPPMRTSNGSSTVR